MSKNTENIFLFFFFIIPTLATGYSCPIWLVPTYRPPARTWLDRLV